MAKNGQKGENHEELIRTFELEQQPISKEQIDFEAEPVNILIFDGGGMKGYATSIIVEYIQEKCKERGSLRDQFHLFAGTSVGGVASLLLSKNKTIDEFLVEAREMLDDIRETSFGNLKQRKVWAKGRMVKQMHSIEEIVCNRFGSEELYCPDSIPAFALSAARHVGSKVIKPFVLRTYKYPSTASKKEEETLVESSSSISFAEAVAATSALPAVFKPIKICPKGKKIELADGGIFCESPVAIAISEAQRLYPNRPLGVIMSIGLDIREDERTCRSIDIARKYHPNLYYHRVIPHQILSKFNIVESNPDKVAAFEEDLRHFLHTDATTNSFLEATINKLFATTTIRPKGRELVTTRSKKVYDLSGEGAPFLSTASIIASAKHQNRVYDMKNGWQGYNDDELVCSLKDSYHSSDSSGGTVLLISESQ